MRCKYEEGGYKCVGEDGHELNSEDHVLVNPDGDPKVKFARVPKIPKPTQTRLSIPPTKSDKTTIRKGSAF